MIKLEEWIEFVYIHFSFKSTRETLAAQLDLAETKAESEQLARGLLEEQYFELTQESKKAASRNRQEIADKEHTVSRVSVIVH